MRSLAIASGIAVLVACAASVTLLPACLGVARPAAGDPQAGSRSARPAAGRGRPTASHAARGWCWSAARCCSALLAAPALDLRLGQLDAGSWPERPPRGSPTTPLAEGFGPGANGPLLVTATYPVPLGGPARPGHHAAHQRCGRLTPAWRRCRAPQLSEDRTVVRFSVQPTTAPSDPAHLRARRPTALRRRCRSRHRPPTSHVGGLTAGKHDLTDRISSRMVLVVGGRRPRRDAAAARRVPRARSSRSRPR